MKKKLLITLLLCIFAGVLSASAQDEEYVIITGSSVNVRAYAYSGAQVIGTVYKNEVYQLHSDPWGDWVPILFEYWDGSDSTLVPGFINHQYCSKFRDNSIPASLLKRKWTLYGQNGLSGTLTFSHSYGTSWNASLHIVNNEWVRSGGSGTVENNSFPVSYVNGWLLSDYCNIIYDASRGLLYCGCYVWK